MYNLITYFKGCLCYPRDECQAFDLKTAEPMDVSKSLHRCFICKRRISGICLKEDQQTNSKLIFCFEHHPENIIINNNNNNDKASTNMIISCSCGLIDCKAIGKEVSSSMYRCLKCIKQISYHCLSADEQDHQNKFIAGVQGLLFGELSVLLSLECHLLFLV